MTQMYLNLLGRPLNTFSNKPNKPTENIVRRIHECNTIGEYTITTNPINGRTIATRNVTR